MSDITRESAAAHVATLLSEAAKLADRLDAITDRRTTIEVNPDSFMVVVEIPRGRAGHVARKAMIARGFIHALALHTPPEHSLIEAVAQAHAQAAAEEAAYAQRAANGELTTL